MKLLSTLLILIFTFSISAAEKPNIIIFLVDDMGMMDTSVPFITDAKGQAQIQGLNKYFKTPAMEKLASRGIRFNQFCAQSVCSPSRTSIISGQNATRHQTTTWIRPESNNRGQFGPQEWNWHGIKAGDPVLPKVLAEAGYRTIHIGKAHFGNKKAAAADPTKIGFQFNVGGDCWGRPKSYYSEDHYGNHPKYKNKKGPVTHNVPHLEKYYDSGTFLTEALTLETIKLLKKSVADKAPFFLHMSHYALHSPFNSDPRFAAKYKGKKSPRAQAFATLVEGMDKSLNDIMNTLEELNIAEDTLIIFLGDNGSDAPLGAIHKVACAAPLRGKKGTHYEGGMRVPFIAAWAKPNAENKFQKQLPIKQNSIQTQMATVMDIYPTLLELANVSSPAKHEVDGRSLKKLFSGSVDDNHPKSFLMHFPHDHRSKYYTTYRTQDWKLIYHYNPQNPSEAHCELFHLKNDPYEQEDLSSSSPEKLSLLKRAMLTQLKKEGALFPIDKNGSSLIPR